MSHVSKPPFTRCRGENSRRHSQFLSLSRISSNRRWEKVPFSKYIRHPTSSHQLHPSHDNIPGDTQEPPTGPPASIRAPLAVLAAIQAKGVFRNHKANRTSTVPCSEAVHGLPISDRPPMIWPPLRPHLTSLSPPSSTHMGLPDVLQDGAPLPASGPLFCTCLCTD